MNSQHLSSNEYAPYYKPYVASLGSVNLNDALLHSLNATEKLLTDLSEEKLNFRYDKGKWSIKEVLQHIIDAERVLSYRALRFSRNDATEIHGYDENWYVDYSEGDKRTAKDLLEELVFVRKSNIALFNSFTDEMMERTGIANESEFSVRALGFIIAGHHKHHLKVISEKYL